MRIFSLLNLSFTEYVVLLAIYPAPSPPLRSAALGTAGYIVSLYVFPVVSPASSAMSLLSPLLLTLNLGGAALCVPSSTLTVTFSSLFARLASSAPAAFVVTYSGVPFTTASGAFPVIWI